MNLFQLIHSDYKKYRNYGGNFFSIVFFTQGFWAILQYRVARSIHLTVKLQPFRLILKSLTLLWQKWVEIITGISIPASASIGHSFYIGHFGGIIINADACLGANCNISQGVTIGVSGRDAKRGVPVIGNNVYIGANSVVVGNIRVGDNALIGACSLVNSSISSNSVAIGVPAIIISQNGSKGYL